MIIHETCGPTSLIITLVDRSPDYERFSTSPIGLLLYYLYVYVLLPIAHTFKLDRFWIAGTPSQRLYSSTFSSPCFRLLMLRLLTTLKHNILHSSRQKLSPWFVLQTPMCTRHHSIWLRLFSLFPLSGCLVWCSWIPLKCFKRTFPFSRLSERNYAKVCAFSLVYCPQLMSYSTAQSFRHVSDLPGSTHSHCSLRVHLEQRIQEQMGRMLASRRRRCWKFSRE